MPFKDIACHVWAIDGYSDDESAGKVNKAYEAFSGQCNTQNSKGSREETLRYLLKNVRLAGATGAKAKLYGGFRRGQKAPEHMWLEYEGHIYDTMPGYGLCCVDATAAYRKCPGLENEDFGDGAVCIDMTLTESQLKLIQGGDFIKAVH